MIITMNLKEQGAKFIIAKAMRAKHANILQQIQTDMIVFPEIDMAHQLAENLVHPKVIGQVDLGDGYMIEGIKAPERLVGQPVGKIASSLPPGVRLVGIHREGELLESPEAAEKVLEGDLVLVWGRRSRVMELER